MARAVCIHCGWILSPFEPVFNATPHLHLLRWLGPDNALSEQARGPPSANDIGPCHE